MKSVLVDSSVWIAFFRTNAFADRIAELIEAGQIVINDLILAELLPSVIKSREKELHDLLLAIRKVKLSIDWGRIISMQTANLRSGHNNIGLPDLIIAQNAIDNNLLLFHNDKHFRPLEEMFGLQSFDH